MSEFARSRAMRQFYRNVFTRHIELIEADVMPVHLVAEIFTFKSAKLDILGPQIRDVKTGLAPEKDEALKNLLCAIILANHALDEAKSEEQLRISAETATQIIEYVVAALKDDNNVNYLVAAIQILFRVNEIASALFLINNNLSLVSHSAPVLKILLLICLMEDDYNQAMVVIQALTEDAALIGEDPIALLMITCGIYKLGGVPDSYIDFRSLNDDKYVIADAGYDAWFEKTSSDKTTVLVTCNKEEYFEHALPLIYSAYETNRDVLDVHLHLYNCDDEVKQSITSLRDRLPELHISASLEKIAVNDDMAIYAASRRLIFLRHALQTFGTPVIAVNCNVLIRQRWSPSESPLMLLHSESSPFWEDVFAGFIYAAPGGVAQRYFERVARFIDANLSGGNSAAGLEQVALSASLDTLAAMDQLAVSRPERTSILDSEYTVEAFCWLAETLDGPAKDYKASLIQKFKR
ncbi:hypothetical protein M8013_15150 [Enterobacteriaceae bacterium H4N4]|uniref:Uncharacterized protein n=1 Tax=Silvania confinis TaxID=2926470 RepID=A0A9J6QGR9_9ENTR|nr:hypothetical protein [Silvania confinis]MCU6670081.1 hypothetical protein [Silvania confinis]